MHITSVERLPPVFSHWTPDNPQSILICSRIIQCYCFAFTVLLLALKKLRNLGHIKTGRQVSSLSRKNKAHALLRVLVGQLQECSLSQLLHNNGRSYSVLVWWDECVPALFKLCASYFWAITDDVNSRSQIWGGWRREIGDRFSLDSSGCLPQSQCDPPAFTFQKLRPQGRTTVPDYQPIQTLIKYINIYFHFSGISTQYTFWGLLTVPYAVLKESAF